MLRVVHYIFAQSYGRVPTLLRLLKNYPQKQNASILVLYFKNAIAKMVYMQHFDTAIESVINWLS